MTHDPIVIVGAARTPMGGFQGDFAGVAAADLGAAAIGAALDGASLDIEWILGSGGLQWALLPSRAA